VSGSERTADASSVNDAIVMIGWWRDNIEVIIALSQKGKQSPGSVIVGDNLSEPLSSTPV
jgi:hypothetical protein